MLELITFTSPSFAFPASALLVAIGGDVLWGNGGNAVSGKGTIATKKVFLQGATANTSNKAESFRFRRKLQVLCPYLPELMFHLHGVLSVRYRFRHHHLI